MRFLVILSISLTATNAFPQFNWDGGSSNSNDYQLVGYADCSPPEGLIPFNISAAIPDIIDFLYEKGNQDAIQVLLKWKQELLCYLLQKQNPEETTPGNDYPG